MAPFARTFLAGLLLVALGGCGASSLGDLTLQRLDGRAFPLTELGHTPLAVFFFLSPECPLCENYSRTINQLRDRFSSDTVAFYGIFPGTYYSPAEIRAFLSRYRPQVTVLLDPDYAVTHRLGATVTPEAYLLDAAGQVHYQGKIDNWIPKLGQKRVHITEHYLRDALEARLQGQAVAVRRVPAIGCLIE